MRRREIAHGAENLSSDERGEDGEDEEEEEQCGRSKREEEHQPPIGDDYQY